MDRDKKNEYDIKYHKEHYKRFVFEMKPELKARWIEAARSEGKNLSQFVRDVVNDYIAKKEERGE